MSDTDLELLAGYRRDRADESFTELVRRHLKLEHAARRGIRVLVQVGLVKWHLRRWTAAIRQHLALLGCQFYYEPEYRQGGGASCRAAAGSVHLL